MSAGVGSAISLPKGGGAVRGIGETFQPNLFTGTGNFSIPIATSPGRNGFGPALSLQYTSGAGNGPFGLGWSLSIPKIARKTERGLPHYDEADTYVASGTEDLVPTDVVFHRANHVVRLFRPRTESQFSRIEQWQHETTGATHWRAITRDNITSIYGRTRASRLFDLRDETRVFEWYLEETFDAVGNHVLYEYARDSPETPFTEIFEQNRSANQLYIRRICYGNLPSPLIDDAGVTVTYADGSAVGRERGGRRYAFEVVFDYGDGGREGPDGVQELFGLDVPVRDDRFSQYRSGFEIRTLRRCQRVLMFHHFAELGGPTLVRSTDFEYRAEPETLLSFLASVTSTSYRKNTSGEYETATLPSVKLAYSEYRPREQRYEPISARGRELPAVSLDDPDVALVDLFGDGLPDIVQSTVTGMRYWKNLGDGLLDRPRSLSQVPAGLRFSQPGVAFGDMAGDGRADLLVLSGPRPGFYETTPDATWERFRAFDTLPSLGVDDPNARLLDLTGDGRSDMLKTGADAFVWCECRGEAGFGPPQFVTRHRDLDRFPDVFFDDPRIRLADMTGNGMNDIVFVHANGIDYWPNLGYGRFGARITMGDAPQFDSSFEPKRLLLADVDGTGCADLVYVDFDRVHVWFNRSGNSWSSRVTVLGTPETTDADSVRVADFFGTGTTSIVWSYRFTGQPDATYKALDLCGGVKPHVLVEMSSGAGSSTRVTYSTSVMHFLEDDRAGTPWRTKLPFPVHVVDQVDVIDHVAETRLTTRFKYHDGYFDGDEREFRGFARVDRFDAEEHAAIAHRAPPIETRTWFHTGEARDDGTLGDHEIDNGGSPREAHRALRGAIVRTEVYGRDGSSDEERPFTVLEQRYRVMCLHPGAPDRHAVYFRHPREEVTSHFERDDDPRIEQTLTLDVDAWGNTTRAVAVAYGRLRADPSLPRDEDRATQARTHVVYRECSYTNEIDLPDHYRTPVECEHKKFELTGFTPSPRFATADFAGLDAAPEIAPEADAPLGVPAKRLTEHVRTYFRTDDLAGLLPFGVIEPMAIAGLTQQLVFTPGMVAAVYGSLVTAAMMQTDGGYVHSEGDDAWWAPSGRTFFSTDPTHTHAEELAVARRTFFMPQRFRDVFGNETVSRCDPYCLMTTQTIDAVGNMTRAECDYRTLQVHRLTDPNGNRSEVAFDILGGPIASAVGGKPGDGEGDDLQGVITDIDEAALDAFFADPVGQAALLLGRATTRTVLDVHRFSRTGQACFEATLSRDRHVSDPTAATIAVQLAYVDGFGRSIQRKVLADDGRWITSGTTVFDNKGKPVRQYEPFFDTTHELHLVAGGANATLFYDPADRAVGRLRSDHAWSKVVFDAWRREDWDVNDTVGIADPRLDPDIGGHFQRLSSSEFLPTWHAERASGALGQFERDAARKTEVHANTPSIAYVDALGRTFATTAVNRFEREGTIVEERGVTRFVLDVNGNTRATVDANDRVVMRRTYDLLDRTIASSSIDAGERSQLAGVGGQTIYAWNSRGERTRITYDAAMRPVDTFVTNGTHPERLVGRTIYGETAPAPEAANLRGRARLTFDQVGIFANERYDFKGNALAVSRRLTTSYRDIIDWATSPSLEAEVLTTHYEYDARSRPITRTTPDGSIVRQEFNVANQLRAVDVQVAANTTRTVTSIDYNARGQRTQITYGNGVTTEYQYDPMTFRAVHVETRRGDGAHLQNIDCSYDAAGHVTSVRDHAQSTIYFNNQVVAADADYTYDALYQLIEASGREHIGQVPATTWDDRFRIGLPHPGDGQAMRRYTEQYTYDLAGNISELAHRANGADWTRRYDYQPDSNRLARTTVGTSIDAYGYDDHGNTTALPHAPSLAWDFRDRLVQVDLAGGGTAFYAYDAAGRRVRKVIEKNGGARVEEVIDLGGLEIIRLRTGGGTLVSERETLHIVDDEQRIALVETLTVEDGSSVLRLPRLRYQCNDQLSSVALELDAEGLVISYEQYYPFGGTSYQAVDSETHKPKRYRQAAKERDEETGFVYFGARYYAPWLGRWLSSDPALLDRSAGVPVDQSPYAYCSNDPINRIDPAGRIDYYDSEGDFLGNDGKKNDTEFLFLLDSKDVSMVRDRYQGGWLRRHAGGLIGAIVGLLVGLATFLFPLGAVPWLATIGLPVLGYWAGNKLMGDWFRPERPTAVSGLNKDKVVAPPPMLVRQAAKDALERSKHPVPQDPDRPTLLMDTQGEHHEEGGIWGLENGTLVVGQAKPGPFADPRHDDASIDLLDLVPPGVHPDRIQGTFHIHPEGYIENTTGGIEQSGQTYKAGASQTTKNYFVQPPSVTDINTVTGHRARPDGQTGYSFVVGAGSHEVYLYDERNSESQRYFAKINMTRFFKGTR